MIDWLKLFFECLALIAVALCVVGVDLVWS